MIQKIAFVFPGQGSQYVGMGKDMFDSSEVTRWVFNQVDNISGYDISGMCFNGPIEKLSETRYCQLAILAMSLACLKELEAQSNGMISPAIVAGHSLGEYTALVCAGVLSVEDAFRIVKIRAELMHQAAVNIPGKMAAVIGLDKEIVDKICEDVTSSVEDGVLEIANLNCPGQIVITGTDNAVNKGIELCKAIGAKRVVELSVSGAFHSSLMKDVADKLKYALNDININDASIPIVVNVDAEVKIKADEFKETLSRQVSSSVLWEASINTMINYGVNTFVEIGPGKVLAGLIKRINKNVDVISIGSIQEISSIISMMNKSG